MQTTHPPRFTKADRSMTLWTVVYLAVIILVAWAVGYEPLSDGHHPSPCETHAPR